MATTGSLRGVTIDGIPYNAAGDADAARGARYEKTAIPHSGGNIFQWTLVPASVDAVKLTLTASEYETLKVSANSLDDIPMSYIDASGSSFKTVGTINLGPHQSMDNSCEITMLTSTGDWDTFAAE